jgi:riboflavin kinase/FMN adenylyltransferase
MMERYFGLDAVPARFGPSAVTIGKFDGVHVGHRAVLAQLHRVSEERGLLPVVVTFDRHPLALLAPESAPESLVSLEQKLELLAETGVAATVVLPFDERLSRLPAEQFVQEVLGGRLRARAVLVGSDFRFGANGAGNVQTLRELGPRNGFDVVLVDDVGIPDEQEPVHRASSTAIRRLLADGHPRDAAKLLGHLHTVRSIVVHGQQRGRLLGYPTANLDARLEGLVPADGVYAAWLTVDGQRYPAAVSVGNNPTFTGVPEKQVEAYALDEDFDIYGKTVELAFVEYVRGMLKFDGLDPLIAQMRDDVERVRGILGVVPLHRDHEAGAPPLG